MWFSVRTWRNIVQLLHLIVDSEQAKSDHNLDRFNQHGALASDCKSTFLLCFGVQRDNAMEWLMYINGA